jgi:CRISPR-associated protein Cas1
MSPALMRLCVEHNVSISFLSENGTFLARVTGPVKGNVMLRKKQFAVVQDEDESTKISKNIITGKILNSRAVLQRSLRDHGERLNSISMQDAIARLAISCKSLDNANNRDSVRGIEGESSRCYFEVMDNMIVTQKEDFFMKGRNRRPPLDRFNALLSFLYALVYSGVTSALETVGLDPAVGFLHAYRSGRNSLALDIMEEFRPFLADRFALTLVNRRQIQGDDFLVKENGAVLLNDKGRKKVLDAYQIRKHDVIQHPFLDDKIEIGLLPYAQALLMARYLRGDIESYPPYISQNG